MASIPVPEPSDTVWWHTDVVHSDANEHNGEDYANVICVGEMPDCTKNRAYLQGQGNAFKNGRSAPDFAPEDYEVDFKNRSAVEDLTALDRHQMGYG